MKGNNMKKFRKYIGIIVLSGMMIFLCQCNKQKESILEQENHEMIEVPDNLVEILPESEEPMAPESEKLQESENFMPLEQEKTQEIQETIEMPKSEINQASDTDVAIIPEIENSTMSKDEVAVEQEELVEVDQVASENMEYLAEQGYYKIISTRDGGYQVMVHGNEAAYGRQLLQEYLAQLGCYNNGGITGGWIDESRDQYIVSVDGNRIFLLDDNENDW